MTSVSGDKFLYSTLQSGLLFLEVNFSNRELNLEFNELDCLLKCQNVQVYYLTW